MIRVQEARYRGLWESDCIVTGCLCRCTITGTWSPWIMAPVFALPPDSDWYYQWPKRLAHGAVLAPRGLFCPEHALLWRKYVIEVKAWEATRKDQRKTWWMAFKSIFTRDLPLPKCPFEWEE